MQLTLPVSVLVTLALFLPNREAAADELTGRWTGAVEVRGNYYYEKSTRVVAPEISISLEAPNGIRVNTEYLVDSITSASIAVGALEDVRFTEIRHDVTAGFGYEFDLDEQQLDIEASVRVSKEPDYLSTSGSVGAALFLDEKNTVLRASLGILHDEIRQNFRGAGSAPGKEALKEDFNAVSIGAGWEQVLSPTWLLQITYDLSVLNGFLANAYRSIASVQRPETHPQNRRRHTLASRLAWHIPQSRTSLHLMYRAYFDTWELAALNPEFRVYQELSKHLQLRVRYRYYKQTSSFFHRDDPSDYNIEDRYVTADPKMDSFRNHELGGQLVIFGHAFESTALDFLKEATLDLNFDYIISSSAYGNGVVAEVGLRVPF